MVSPQATCHAAPLSSQHTWAISSQPPHTVIIIIVRVQIDTLTSPKVLPMFGADFIIAVSIGRVTLFAVSLGAGSWILIQDGPGSRFRMGLDQMFGSIWVWIRAEQWLPTPPGTVLPSVCSPMASTITTWTCGVSAVSCLRS